MYSPWLWVFCSVVVGRASPDLPSSSGNVLKPVDLPSNETINNGTEKTFRLVSINNLKNHVLNPLTKAAEGVTSVILPATNAEVCYKVLGCFPMGSPWKTILRPIGEPMSPENIRASVYFSCRENMHSKTIDLYPEINLEGISFMPRRTTVFIVHGFSSSGKADWVEKLATTYLKVKDVNLFSVNWEEGARGMNYLQVAANARVVGKELALLIYKLIREHKAKAKNFHLIGHSLGAHVCSYAAKEIPGIGHLTALDPAQPGFEGFSEEVRLDKSDAKYVEVLHTDARPFIPTLGFGMITSHGHVDFYFNGIFQPGCLIPKTDIKIEGLHSLAKFPVEVLCQMISCAHLRAYEYYTEAIDTSNCTFWGQKIRIMNPLKIIASLNEGIIKVPEFLKCTPQNCIPLGLSTKKSPLRGVFLVLTRMWPPYCKG